MTKLYTVWHFKVHHGCHTCSPILHTCGDNFHLNSWHKCTSRVTRLTTNLRYVFHRIGLHVHTFKVTFTHSCAGAQDGVGMRRDTSFRLLQFVICHMSHPDPVMTTCDDLWKWHLKCRMQSEQGAGGHDRAGGRDIEGGESHNGKRLREASWSERPTGASAREGACDRV